MSRENPERDMESEREREAFDYPDNHSGSTGRAAQLVCMTFEPATQLRKMLLRCIPTLQQYIATEALGCQRKASLAIALADESSARRRASNWPGDTFLRALRKLGPGAVLSWSFASMLPCYV